ncbi:MAG: hypothetical protein KGI33_01095 [Thaumarchaeota archaeon]|nr:hypothetical protein [Nitrososphaerota archaeon]
MRNRTVIYILFAALTVSLAGNEILYDTVLSLQKDLRGFSDANEQMMDKASNSSLNNATTPDSPAG